MKKFLSIVLSLFMFVSSLFSVSLFATDLDRDMYLEKMTEYAINILPKHLHALSAINATDRYQIGKAFTIFHVQTKQKLLYYPIIKNNNIFALMGVICSDNVFSSNFSTALVQNLYEINKKAYLLTDGTQIQAWDGKNTIQVADLSNNTVPCRLIDFCSHDDLREIEPIAVTDLLQPQDHYFGLTTERAPIYPKTSKILSVDGVLQVGNTCWAATCAALINYYQDESLTAQEVASYVYGSDWNKGGTWTEIKSAYNHWGLFPKETDIVSFRRVEANIDSYRPMHLGLTGHSVALIGYEEWSSEYGGDKILVLLEPNSASQVSVTLNSKGNFSYMLGGGADAWQSTREF